MLILLAALAFAEEDAVHGAPMAMGSAATGMSDDNSVVVVNPGMMGLRVRYDVQGHGRFGPYQGVHWATSIVDADSSELFAVGIHYTGERSDPPLTTSELPGWWPPGEDIPNRRRSHDLAVALAGHDRAGRFSAGVSINGGYYNNDRTGVGWSLDTEVGVGFRPSKIWTIGLAGNNLLEDQLGGRRRVSAGTELYAVRFRFVAEAGYIPALEAITAGGGMSFQASEAVQIRGGYRVGAPEEGQWASAGFALMGLDNALEYSMQLRTDDKVSFAGSLHMLSFTVSMPKELTDTRLPRHRDI